MAVIDRAGWLFPCAVLRNCLGFRLQLNRQPCFAKGIIRIQLALEDTRHAIHPSSANGGYGFSHRFVGGNTQGKGKAIDLETLADVQTCTFFPAVV